MAEVRAGDPSGELSPNLLAADLAGEAFDVPSDGDILAEQLLDLPDRVEHGGVILAAEVATQLLQGGSSELTAQVDADLTGLRR